jgi:steroid 5-alpha reductase family enzyme
MTAVLVLVVTVGLSVAMAGAWLVQRLTRNAGWVDVIWTFATGVAGVVYALAARPGGPGVRQLLLAALIVAWSARLGLHILDRTRGRSEDTRYAAFRAEWGAGFERRMFWFLQIQAGAAALLALSMLLAAANPRTHLSFGDVAGIVVLAVAVAGEALADWQLRRFRADPANAGRVCDHGLWGWSRHPNYFFEWLGWVAYPLFAINLGGVYPWGWLALSAPACMYWLLVHVSGIPPLEQQMLRSRGDAFRAYQARVSPFIPLPGRRTP